MVETNLEALNKGVKLYEDSMRRFVKERLIAKYPNNWWENGILKILTQNLLNTLKRAMERHPRKDKLEYIEAKHLGQIITRNSAFNDVFTDARWTEVHMDLVATDRDQGAHPGSGDLSEDMVAAALLNIEELLKCAKLPEATDVATLRKTVLGAKAKPEESEALAYVYIAQFVRRDGPTRAGVLAEDCQTYHSQIIELLSKGDVQEKSWLHLEGFVTSPQGTQKAKMIVSNRLLSHSTRLGSEFEGMPRRPLQYLFQYILAGDVLSFEVRPERGYGCSHFYCLLANDDVLEVRDRLFQVLLNMKLIVMAHHYVSTRSGEMRDNMYVQAPELQSFYRDYLVKAGLARNLWSQDLEEMHVVFHILDSWSNLPSRIELIRKIPVRYRESVNEFVNECLANSVLTESTYGTGEPYIKINDIKWYDSERTRRYQKPLLDFLLGQNPPQNVEQSGRDPHVASKATADLVAGADKGPFPIKVGNLLDHGQHGLLGRVDNRDVVLDLYEPHAITVLGVQGSGKSYAAGAIIEMAVRVIPGISTLTKPLSCIIFHFSKEENRVPEWIGLASANSSPSQIERLKVQYSVSPDSVPHANINVLVPPTKVSDRRKQYPGFNVMPLVFSPSKLKADDWRRLLTFGKGSDALYMQALRNLMIDLRDKKANFEADDLKDEIAKSDLEPNQKKFALQRIKTIGRWLSQDGQPFVDLLKPGVVNIVDLRDPLAVDAGMASLVLQTVFSFVKDRPPEGICLVAIDEAHLFFEHEHLTKEIIEFVALLRKDYRVYLLLMSQQPGRFHPDILALSDIIICYRLESDTELDFLKKNKPAFADVTKDIKKLKTGEGKAFLWARVSTDDLLEKPQLISVRPKVTEDRGKTATAF